MSTNSASPSWFKRHKILTGILVFVALLVVLGAMSDPESAPTTPGNTDTPAAQTETAMEVSAADLYAAYEANEIAADNQYKGKLLKVSGRLESIGKDILDDAYVALATNNAIFTVQCMLDDASVSQAATLSKGAQITVTGRHSGKLGNILLRDCHFD